MTPIVQSEFDSYIVPEDEVEEAVEEEEEGREGCVFDVWGLILRLLEVR